MVCAEGPVKDPRLTPRDSDDGRRRSGRTATPNDPDVVVGRLEAPDEECDRHEGDTPPVVLTRLARGEDVDPQHHSENREAHAERDDCPEPLLHLLQGGRAPRAENDCQDCRRGDSPEESLQVHGVVETRVHLDIDDGLLDTTDDLGGGRLGLGGFIAPPQGDHEGVEASESRDDAGKEPDELLAGEVGGTDGIEELLHDGWCSSADARAGR